VYTRRLPRGDPFFPYTTLFRSEERRIGEHGTGLVAFALGGTPCGQRLSADADGGERTAEGPQRDQARCERGLAVGRLGARQVRRSEEHTSELQSRSDLVCRLLL